jgi:hypothetical protein
MSRSHAFLTSRLMLLSFLAVLTCAAPALGNLVAWNLSGVALLDGGSVTGSFIYDTVAQSITSWGITATAEPIPGIPFPPSVANSFSFSSTPPANSAAGIKAPLDTANGPETEIWFATPYAPPTPQYVLTLSFQFPLDLASPGTYPLVPTGVQGYPSAEGDYYFSSGATTSNNYAYFGGRFVTSGGVSAVPLPPSAFLLGSCLIPLAWARRKKRLEQ